MFTLKVNYMYVVKYDKFIGVSNPPIFFNEPADKGDSTVIKSYSEEEGPGDEKVG